MIALFDIDGPLVLNMEHIFFEWANKLSCVTRPWEYKVLVETGNWRDATGGLSRDQLTEIYTRFVKSDAHPAMRVTPGAAVVLRRLNNITKHIATARGDDLRTETMSFLEEKICRFAECCFGVLSEKGAVAQNVRATHFIDDSVREISQAMKVSDAQPILFPSRAPRDTDNLNGVKILKAESLVRDGMTEHEYAHACVLAWQEIETILEPSN